MITEELLSYITKQLKNGVSRDTIISKLVGAGWMFEDVKEGFSKVDIYHEPLFEEPVKEDVYKLSIDEKVEPLKIEDKEKPEVEPLKFNINIEEKKEVKNPETAIVLDTKELPEGQKEQVVKKEEVKVSNNPDLSRVWIPKSIPVKEKPYSPSFQSQTPEINNAVTLGDNNKVKEEDISTPVSKTIIDSFNNLNKEKIQNDVPVDNSSLPQGQDQGLSKIAMLSSYQSDMRAIKGESGVSSIVATKTKKSKWLIYVLILVIIAAGAFFAYQKGLFGNIKVLNQTIVSSPKEIILNSSNKLLSLKSYKTETIIDVSSVAMRDILPGVLSEENSASISTDSLNINILGLINNNQDSKISDNFITAKGSFIPNYITSDIKINGDDLFISVPDLKQFEDKFSPEPSIVKINKNEMNLLYSLFSQESSKRLVLTNLSYILSSGIASHVQNDILNSYNSFINNTEIADKGEEVVKGINTHHYSITTDNIKAKDIIRLVYGNFSSGDLPEEKKDELNMIVDDTTIESFDVWVGANDNNIYQYSLKVSFPLSDVLTVSDEMKNEKVSISWKTAFYDFDVQNNIFIPTEYKTLDSFAKETKKIKIKNEMVSFQKESLKLFDKEKTYGLKSNTSGSCVSVTSGSIFSKEGHNEGTGFNTNLMSIIFANILNDTGNKGSCYSSLAGWSMSMPIADDYGTGIPSPLEKTISYFCVDSTGAKEELASPSKGVSCLPKTQIKTTTQPKVTTVKQNP